MGGAFYQTVTADLIAVAIVASARAFGDDPVEAVTTKNAFRRRSLGPAISALHVALAPAAKINRLAMILNVNKTSVSTARNDPSPAFWRAESAAMTAVRGAVARRVREAPSTAIDEALEEALPDFLTAPMPERAAPDPVEPAAEEANGVRLDAQLKTSHDACIAASVGRAGRTITPERAPRPNPAPASRPAPPGPPPRPAPPVRRPPISAGRKAPRGATVRSLGGGVEVIQLKPITESILRHARAQVENGLDVGEAADLFDVDADQLAAKLKTLGARR